jgi:hypothetical protein
MALSTKINLSVSTDWKSIIITDSTGYGITGYGSNQDPVGLREASGSGTDIISTRIILTSPSDTIYTFDLNASQAYTATISPYTITNVALGLNVDEIIEEGIWKVSYTPYFANSQSINVTNNSTTVTYSASPQSFTNIAKLKTNVSGTAVYYDVTAINPSTNNFTLATPYAATTTVGYTNYNVGYEATELIPISKTIKDCLDSRVAALPQSNCPCKDKQVNTLMNNYLLYDAMFINAMFNNEPKAIQLYDILSNYCSDSDCKCNG